MMTDSNATERVKELLEIAGARYREHGGIRNGSMDWYTRFVVDDSDSNLKSIIETCFDGENVILTLRCAPEQAVAATLGSPTLTYEQVRESIERNFGKVAVLDDGKPVEWRDDWVCKVGVDYKSITDELNEWLRGKVAG